MKIAICASMTFHEEMRKAKAALEKAGHFVFMPKGVELMDTVGYEVPPGEGEKLVHKIEHDFIREHFRKIEKSDAILVLNYTKKGIDNYIGGNTFLEIGLAYWLEKKIFLNNPVPEMDYKTEIEAMQPVVIDGNLSKIA